MSLEQIQQNYADATGFVIDRTVSPPKILGQAFLVSKSRAVTCASSVFNYVEAPWALGLNFIHPDVTDSIKNITLHQDFDKVAARKWYLAQTGNPGDQLILPNDMASLSLDFNTPNVEPDKLAELNRALSLPFSSEGVESSGNIRGIEFLSVLQNILQTGREGLFTLLDGRNLPIGRIQVASGNIQKVYFRGLLGELAFFELVYRKPAEGFSFQTTVPFNWGNVRDITAPAPALIEEAQRRVSELPGMLNYLGGSEARYQKRVENVEPSQVSENIQWLMERLWATIDGYMTLDKMSERVGADTFTVVQAMRECVNRGFVSMINRSTPFHCSHEVGTPLVSHTDFEVNAWDPLQAFYLDPLSGRPTWMQGNFFGVANALQPKNMLHTIAMPNNVPGALILKDYKLIGIHSGAQIPKPGTPLPPVKLYQMMWMGALLEMSSKRVKSDDGATGEQSSAISGLRGKMELDDEAVAAAAAQEKLEKYVCSNCYTTNTKVGPCFNCGTTIEPPPPEEEPEDAKSKAVSEIAKLQKKYNVTNAQLALVAAVVIGVPVFGFAFCGGSGTPPPAVTDPNQSAERVHKSSDKAVALATKYAGFQGTAVGGYWYDDTSDKTKPAQSFGLNSELSNQRILFVIMDDLAPVQNLGNFVGLPPFVDDIKRAPPEKVKIDEGRQIIGDGDLQWFVGSYEDAKEGPHREVLTAAYASPEKNKSILVVGTAYDPSKGYDPKMTLGVIDQMASEFTANGNSKRTGTDKKLIVEKPKDSPDDTPPPEEKPLATESELDEFVEAVGSVIQNKLKTPDDIAELLAKKKPPKIKSTLSVVLNEDGTVKKLEIIEPGDYESATTALNKAVNAASPYENVPHTKDGQVSLIVKLDGNKIKTERP